MAPKGNRVVPNAHFHKHWERYVRTWFNQPGRKQRRRKTRIAKAAKIAPRPVAGPLRPIVRCPTFKYNSKLRLGRGFSLEEIKAVGLTKVEARRIGIAVDHRRINRNVEALQLNVQRLKEYQTRLVLFPTTSTKRRRKREGLPPLTESEEFKMVTQLKGPLMPIVKEETPIPARIPTAEEKAFSPFNALRTARALKRMEGQRQKRLREAQQ